MANMLESFGLDFLDEDEDTLMNVVGYVVTNGKTISSYRGAPYFFMPMGKAEFWAGTERNEEGKLQVSGFHTHCCGRVLWEMICSEIDLTPKDCPKNERILMLNRSIDNGGMLPVEIINADVLPSFLKGDRLTLQIVAPCLDVCYYATEEEYCDAQPSDKRGKKWMIADGALLALAFLENHTVDKCEEEKDYSDDAYVHFRATVKALYHGVFAMGEMSENTFIRCVADTIYGEMEFLHSIDQVPEEMVKNIKIGSIISGVCILSADAAVKGYEKGIVKDFDHDLRLLRHTLQKGEAERMSGVLNDNSVYETETNNGLYIGSKAIIEQFQYVTENHKGKYFAHLAEITDAEEENMEFPVGTQCIVLAADQENNYESIVFMTTDEDGNIARIKVSRDGRYRFKIHVPEKVKTPLDDFKIPDSVAEPIIMRAKYHYLIDEETEYGEITEDSDYSAHETNAKWMLDAMQENKSADEKEAVGNILGYLFAKAAEETINSCESSSSVMRLTASYSPDDALRGILRSTLSPELHSKLEEDMEFARQFGKDLNFFLEANGKTDSEFADTFIQAAVIVQRIGQLYAKREFCKKEGEVQPLPGMGEEIL